MTTENKLTQEYLKECLTYNPDTGVFIWEERPLYHFKNVKGFNIWNARNYNKICGTYDTFGHMQISISKVRYLAHRLAFLYMEGYFPENFVDHIDRNPKNNKWGNLREVSNMCNAQNCKLSENNTSGVNGVSFDKRTNKWFSKIASNNKQKYLGSFDNFEDAVKARYQEEVNNPLWTCSVESSAYKYLKDNNLI